MLKNYMKEGQKLPLFGVGPYIVYGMALVNIVGIVIFGYVFKIGILSAPWTVIFRIIGGLLIVAGIAIWYIGALRSDMDDSITENKLQTNGIYSWVRNPMYSGWWIALSGGVMMWHNVWLLILPALDWLIMTVALINTEEKWLLDLYGEEYALYKKRVNRCIPWKRRDGSKRAMFEKSLREEISFDPKTQYAVIRSSICTGEKVAGFKNKTDGHFTEVMLIRNSEDEKQFKETYGIDTIKVEY